ncbi:MAG: prealbumin-like fold domain-containing protein [Microthrixaceae bacterium]
MAVGNGAQFRGINLAFGANQTTIDGNVVAGHAIGIQLISPTTINNVLTANYVGTNASGDALPNRSGIAVYAGPNTVGGSGAGDGNVVHHNLHWGIQVGTANSTTAPEGVRIAGNSIDENGLTAIDLASVGANDAGDADGFENAGQNHPVLSSASGTASATSVDGVLDSNTDEAFRIEVFASPACDGSGKGEAARFLGAVAVTTDSAGHATFSETLDVAIGDGDVVTATATDASGNTSELSACVTATVDTSTALRVNTLTDDTDGICDRVHCSLREAIAAANAAPELDQIRFTVTGTITPGAALPTITAPVDIDGGSAPACAGTPAIEIDGSSAGSGVNGLVLAAGSDGSSIRGLVVNRFGTGSGIQLLSNDNVVQCSYVGTNAAGTASASNRFGVEVQNGNRNLIGGTGAGEGNLLSGNSFQGARITGLGATGNLVKGNRIGTDVTGTSAVGNLAFGGVNLGGTGNQVGGSEPGARNLISGNGHGIFLPNASTNHVIEGNWIGVDVTGNAPLPNSSDGIAINGTPTPSSSGNVIRGNVISGNGNSGVQLSGTNAVGNTIEDNLIGVGADGTTAVRNGHPTILTAGWGVLTTSGDVIIRGNTIHYNGTGVQVGSSTSSVVSGVRITQNSIADNARQSIDLGGDGVTANDAGDADSGPNGLQNHPIITAAATTSVSGTLDATASTGHRIEVFASEPCGEAARFLAAVDVTTDGAGHAPFSVALSGVAAGEQLTVTATTVGGSTSEVSPCAEATVTTARVRIVKTTEPAGGTGFTFTGPAGATPAADGDLRGGDVIAFVQWNGSTHALALLDVATGTVTPVSGTTAARDPEWSPDGTRLAFVTGGTLKVLDLASGVVSSLPSATPSGTKFSPTWSPDGAWIAFHHYSTDDIWVIPSDGLATATQLTGATTYDSNPSWGPDGRIAFSRDFATHDIHVGTFNSSTVSLDGVTGLANTADLTPVARPMDWSPDGTMLVAGAAKVNAQDDLYLVAADGSGAPTQLTSGVTWDHGPTWSSDGAQIAFATDFGGTPKLRTIAANGVGGPQPTALGDAMVTDPSWGRSVVAGSDTYSLDDGDVIGGLVEPGRSVTFSEQATEGWLLSGIDCGAHPRAVVDGSSVVVTPVAGDDILCTFTNSEEPRTGTIIVEKQTLPDGDPTEFAFGGAIDETLGDGDSVSVTVLAGEHVVTETMPASYWLPSSIRCDDDDSTGDTTTASATYRVDVGETVRCVFTNRGYGRVRVAKVSDPAGGTGFQFVETVGTNPPNPPASLDDGDTYGGYGPAGLVRSFTEQADLAWTLASIDCDGHPRAVVDLDERKVTFTPGVGDDILCTFTNVEAPGTIIVEKQTLPDGDLTPFSFTGAVTTSLADGGSEQVTVPAGEHTVTETMPSGSWSAASITCDDGDSTGDVTTASATFRVAPGETVRCVFTNQGTGSVRIAKASDPAGATGFSFTEQVGADPATTFELADGQSGGGVRPGGVTRTFTEQAASGWALDSIDCGAHPSATIDVASRRVTVTPAVGDDIACTFTSIGLPSIAVAKTQRNDIVGGSLTTDPLTGVQPGDQLTYAVQVTNGGPGAARSVTLRDPVPSRARIVGALPIGCSAVGGEVVCDIGDLAPGQSATVAWTVHLTFGCDVAGTRGDDVLAGGVTGERMCGFAGNDQLAGGGGNDLLLGDTPVDLDLSNLGSTATATWTAPIGGGRQASNGVVASLVRGSDGNDALQGNDGDDTGFGQGGNDSLLGQAGIDRLYGGEGTDTADGGDGGDEVAGGPGTDSLTGGTGDDWLHGDDDNDTIDAGTGNDLASGDGGNDVVFGRGGNDHVSGDGGDDSVLGEDGVDRVTGGSGDDVVSGGDGDDHAGTNIRVNHPLQGAAQLGAAGVFGEDGADTVIGGSGGDSLFGGSGNDRAFGGDGDDDAFGGSGRDYLSGGADNDVLYADDPGSPEEGDGLPDGLRGGPGFDTLFGQAGNNITTEVVGNGAGRAGLWGDDDNDFLVGGPNADDAFGGAGNDDVRGGAGRDRLAGDLGDESGADPRGGGAADRIAGGDGPDLIYGPGGSDGHCTGNRCTVPSYFAGAPRNRDGVWTPTLFGGGGVDVIHGGEGHDRLDGGPEPRNVLVGAGDVDFCSFGPAPGDTRDKSCEAPSKGTSRVTTGTWSWAAFR